VQAREKGDTRRFEFGDLVVYPRELRVVRGEESIDISPREAALLEVLFERRGEVVGRDTLLDRCWGIEYFPESRTLDQHIAKLRKKIERNPAEPEWIETVRGVGYRYRERAGR